MNLFIYLKRVRKLIYDILEERKKESEWIMGYKWEAAQSPPPQIFDRIEFKYRVHLLIILLHYDSNL